MVNSRSLFPKFEIMVCFWFNSDQLIDSITNSVIKVIFTFFFCYFFIYLKNGNQSYDLISKSIPLLRKWKDTKNTKNFSGITVYLFYILDINDRLNDTSADHIRPPWQITRRRRKKEEKDVSCYSHAIYISSICQERSLYLDTTSFTIHLIHGRFIRNISCVARLLFFFNNSFHLSEFRFRSFCTLQATRTAL